MTAPATCWCTTCRPMLLSDPGSMRMALCPDCGNKRCPRAHNHTLACTNSNAPGQPGSSWEHVRPAAAPAAQPKVNADRALLELVAKAAGMDVWFNGGEVDGRYCCGMDADGGYESLWNPLTDDGDALRLALRLGMHINAAGMEVGYRIDHVLHIQRVVLTDAGIEAAFRLAITRAAAAIGEAMP